MNSSERSQPLRDPQQITFIMLNRFWALSKKPNTSPSPHMVFLMHNIKLDGMPTKIKLKIQACFTLYFKFWEGTSAKSYKIQLPVLLFLVSHQFLYQQISFFTTFQNFIQHYLKKIFVTNFNGFTQPPNLLIAKSAKHDNSFVNFP